MSTTDPRPRRAAIARALRLAGAVMVLVGAPNVTADPYGTEDWVLTTYSYVAAAGLLLAGLGLGLAARGPLRLLAAAALIMAGAAPLAFVAVPPKGMVEGLGPAIPITFAATIVGLAALTLDTRGLLRVLGAAGTLAAAAAWYLAANGAGNDQLVLDLITVLIGGTILGTVAEQDRGPGHTEPVVASLASETVAGLS